ncbi:hypothetical protein P154DRAFT_582025 [Amniculicola lignicola CBS 123094]|uniref:Uncharacterized protein n=1 Tax=Amniculicola lignicola CBS 123094 TaxID=1392246 RepID=A0A6A5W4Z4_9PLEO|nr:hypothetical protein P154DRAFT_582025 [Amniculicola lignicola CBS 123094]
MFSFQLKGLLALLPLAVYGVTIAPLPRSCSSYPGYNNATGIAGPWAVVADSTGSDFDGKRAGAETFTNNGMDRFGFITIPRRPIASTPNVTFRCTGDKVQAVLSNSPRTWLNIEIAASENWQSSLSYNLQPSYPVEPFVHYVDGVQQPGIFLGARNSSTWNFKFNWGGNAGEYYLLRLSSPAATKARRQDFPVLDDRDWTGFLKIAT